MGNLVEKTLENIEGIASHAGRLGTLAEAILDRILPNDTALAGYCWTETEMWLCGNCCVVKCCHDRECCESSGCGAWGPTYAC